MHFIWVLYHALLHSYPTTDNNTSIGMTWVTLNMGRSAAYRHALLHSYPTTDNNTSTGMIWVTLNMGRSAAYRQGNVREFHIVWRVVTLFISLSFLFEQVMRVTTRFCKNLILAVNDVVLKEPFHGLLRFVMSYTLCIHFLLELFRIFYSYFYLVRIVGQIMYWTACLPWEISNVQREA